MAAFHKELACLSKPVVSSSNLDGLILIIKKIWQEASLPITFLSKKWSAGESCQIILNTPIPSNIFEDELITFSLRLTVRAKNEERCAPVV